MDMVLNSIREFWYYGLPVVVVPIVLLVWWQLRQRRHREDSTWQEPTAKDEEKDDGRGPTVDAIVFERGIQSRRKVPLAMIDTPPDLLTYRQFNGAQVVLLEEVLEVFDGHETRETEAATSSA